MDATNTRRRLELEGYLDLGMWDEVQSLIEEFIAAAPEHPVVLGVLATFGVGVEFVGHAAPVPEPCRLPVASVADALQQEEGSSRATATATPAPTPSAATAARRESPVPHPL